MGGFGEPLMWLVGVGGLWVIVCGWCAWSLMAIIIPCVLMVGGCHFCGWLGLFRVMAGSRRLQEAVVGICHGW